MTGSDGVAGLDWREDSAQAAELIAAGLAPTYQLETGIDAALPPDPYTVLLSGVNNGAGIGLVEVYDRGAPYRFHAPHMFGETADGEEAAASLRNSSVTISHEQDAEFDTIFLYDVDTASRKEALIV